jgi:hypothetical protein
MCAVDELYSNLCLFIHITGKVFPIAHFPLVLERISQVASTGFSPPMRQISLPACHRLVLILLFQDVVLWLIETEQIKAFRPRRN